MDKILYNDNLKLFLYENGKTEEYSCDFHDEYLDRAVRAAQSVEWKTQGFGARFRGDAYAEIQQEKQKLIKEGKIKIREKNSEIRDK